MERYSTAINGLLGAFFILSGAASAQSLTEVTPVQLRVDSSVPDCTFDRARAFSERVSQDTITGSFAIHCKPTARPYRLTTELSPFASIQLENDRYNVLWYVRHGGLACDNGVIHEQAVPLHSGNRAVELIGTDKQRAWSYCVKLSPAAGSQAFAGDSWPLKGALSLTLADAERGFLLPENASRIHVRFEHNSSELSASMRRTIDTLMMNLGDPSQYHVQLHAHASLVGDDDYNHDLSIMRLLHVREYLTQVQGVDVKDTWGQAWGETRPMALNTIDDEATQNRRVDMIFLPKADAVLPKVDVFPAERVEFEETSFKLKQ